MNKRLRISQCMIVKNEEKNIEKALSWGKDLFWEQIVVDTGSSDRTVEIARQMGAQVYYFSWIDDFAAAKNYAIDQAKGDWIAFLDADEYMEAEDGARIAAMLERWTAGAENERVSKTIAILTAWVNLEDDGSVMAHGSQLRFFQNRKDLRYRGRIHEALYLDGHCLSESDWLDAVGEVTIYHTGYAKSVAGEGQKAERNRRILEKELAERPDDPSLMGYLGDTCRSKGENEEAIACYEKAIGVLPFPPDEGWPDEDTRTCRNFVNLLLLLCQEKEEENERIRRTYEKALLYFPGEADLEYILGNYYVRRGDYKEAGRHLERCLDVFERTGNSHHGVYLFANLFGVWENLAVCYFNEGELGKCVNTCVGCLKERPLHMGILKVLLLAFRADAERYARELAQAETLASVKPLPAASGKQVLDFLGKLYDFGSLRDRLFIRKAAAETEYAELSWALRSLFSAEELEMIERSGK
ncbi:MAG: glycosyltransferase [Lachnospiraceae bacterium]|nr:glycosyltransferase [Lachnospiraceae bacterium]